MSLAPDTIHAAIGELEARSRDFETKAGECREAAATLRRLFDVSTLSAALPVALADPQQQCAPHQRQPSRDHSAPAGSSPSRGKGRPTRILPAAIRQGILDYLGRQIHPSKFDDIRLAVGARPVRVRRELGPLIAEGAVVKTGRTGGTRIGLAAVMASTSAPAAITPARAVKDLNSSYIDQPAPAAVPAPVASSRVREQRISQALHRLFLTGASYDSREIMRNVRGTIPDISGGEVEPVLARLVTEKRLTMDAGRWRPTATLGKRVKEIAS